MSSLPAFSPELIRGGPSELGEVMETMVRAFEPQFGEAWTRGQCAGILGMSGVWLMLARLGGEPAGFVLARAIFDEAELLLLAVDPGRRRLGVGRHLLEAVIREAQARGAVRLHLEMREDNPAQFLYEEACFHQVGRRARYYRGNDGCFHDAITLARPLDLGNGTN